MQGCTSFESNYDRIERRAHLSTIEPLGAFESNYDRIESSHIGYAMDM